jgi:hypothetical protein
MRKIDAAEVRLMYTDKVSGNPILVHDDMDYPFVPKVVVYVIIPKASEPGIWESSSAPL